MVRSAAARALVAALFGALGLAACLLEADGFTGGTAPPSGPDGAGPPGAEGGVLPAGPGDGGGGTSPSDGATLPGDAGGGPNLLLNGDFELGCAGWGVDFGFVSEAAVAHGGAKSCRVCMDTNFETGFYRDATLVGHAGETYVADVWLQGAAAAETMAQQGFRTDDLQLYWTGGPVDPTPGPSLDATWLHASSLVTLSAEETQLTFRFHMTQAGNPASVGNVICVYVDDAAIRKLQ